ncbi:MAG: GNAT family N-acetyltransferase [Acidobacteriota bacterium]|nr:GNAT family N-acetyltransferase [Acidobacteriota bacterium]
MSSQDIVLRPGTLGDIQFVNKLTRSQIEAGLPKTWNIPRLIRCLRKPDVVLLLAHLEDDEPVGFALMEYQDQDAHLNLLAVEPNRQGRGIGRLMIEWLEKTARTAAVSRVVAEVRVDNRPARAFYQRLGYRESELLQGYYQGMVSAVRVEHRLFRPNPKEVVKWDLFIDNYLCELTGEL